ncbi:hypothetical protein C8R47DRAFT_1141340 [Mycena vitilis]|nr:hypothetical protein C8R47DRAFT_1141326 [Mycena vitilis]KAJ6476764.1 hypothetical protein C8R47DRAFT_1141340 [Mycena vitilis]
MDATATLPPVLPAELEREIFEVASLSWPRSIPRFMLVAWRVYAWVEPLLYRVVIVDDRDKSSPGTHPLAIKSSILLSLIDTKPSSFFKDNVRHLLLFSHGMAAKAEADVLAACSNVEDLWWSSRAHASVSLIKMPLKRLHCRLNHVFDFRIHFGHGVFTSVTHLEIFDKIQPEGGTMEVWGAMTRLPHLTHLAFNDTAYLPMCLVLLPTWDSLQVLAILLYYWAYRNPVLLEECGVAELAQDARLVTMSSDSDKSLEDWIMGAYAGVDYWSRAEEFIAKQRSGEINPLRYFVDGEKATEKDVDESE